MILRTSIRNWQNEPKKNEQKINENELCRTKKMKYENLFIVRKIEYMCEQKEKVLNVCVCMCKIIRE